MYHFTNTFPNISCFLLAVAVSRLKFFVTGKFINKPVWICFAVRRALCLGGERILKTRLMSNLSRGILGKAFSCKSHSRRVDLGGRHQLPSVHGRRSFPCNYIKHRFSQNISSNGEECTALSLGHPALSILFNALFVFNCF